MIWYILGSLVSSCLWIWLCISDGKITRGDLFWIIPIGSVSWIFCILLGIAFLIHCFENNWYKIKVWFNKVIWKK